MAGTDDSEKLEGMKSLRSSLRLLLEFAGEQRDLGVAELSQRCGLSKSQVSKVLAVFAECRLLVQDPDTRRYAVGARLFALGSRFVTYDVLCREAMPVMRDLVSRTGHSVRLSVLEGDDVLYLLGFEGLYFVDTGWRAGTWLPVHSTSAGRVLLAFMRPERADRLLDRGPLRAVTDRTVTDPVEVRRLVGLARQRGYVTQRGETTPGLGTIAVPVFGAGTEAVGSLGFAFPSHTVNVRDEPRLAEVLHGAARVLSQRIGGTVYPFGNRHHPPLEAPAREALKTKRSGRAPAAAGKPRGRSPISPLDRG